MLMRLLLITALFFLASPARSQEPLQAGKATADPKKLMARVAAQLRVTQALASLRPPLTQTELSAKKRIYEDFIASYPTDAEPHVVFGEFLLSIQQNEEAFQQWALALTLDPNRHDVLAAQADILLQTGQIVLAADTLEKAVVLSPDNAYYQYGLAHIYTLFRNDLSASRRLTVDELITRGTEYFRRAAELAPDNLGYAKAYAEAFYTQPKPDWTLARAAWESLLSRSTEKNLILSHLVRVNIRLCDKKAANLHLSALTDPAFASLREKLQKQIDRL